MKGTEAFKKTIEDYLQDFAKKDTLFVAKLANEKKNIDDCITYIFNQVKKSGAVGFTDDEVFGMAVHYYDEEKIEVGKPINGQVVVNHKVELTEEEIQQAKDKAKEQAVAEAIASQKAKMAQKKYTAPAKKETPEQPTLDLFS